MAAPQIDNRISLGNILVAGGMIVAIAVAWGINSNNVSTMTNKLTEHAAQIAANEGRIRALETTMARQDERMVLILDSLRKIEARIERE